MEVEDLVDVVWGHDSAPAESTINSNITRANNVLLEANIPVIILPDDGKNDVEKGFEVDISFPDDEGAGKSSRGKGVTR